MPQFVAMSTNSSEHAGCALAAHADALVLPAARNAVWGLGYYDSGELLARVSPREDDKPLEVGRALAALRAEVLVLHTGASPRSDSGRLEGAQPFRFQNWVMARLGDLEGFADFRTSVLEAMPSHVRRGIRGDSPDEHFFHLFLSFLFDAGKIGRSNSGTAEIRNALCQAIATIDAFAEAAGHRPSAMSAVVSDGYSIVTAGRDTPIDYALIEGVRECNTCRSSGPPIPGGGTDHDGLRAVLIVSGSSGEARPPFTRLASGAVLSVTSDTKVEFHTLAQIAGR
jgi:hypothetical protein